MNRMQWLTTREREVLKLMLEGLSPTEIAEATHVNLCTVRSHIRQILMKLGVNSQIAAVAHVYKVMLPEDERTELLTKLSA